MSLFNTQPLSDETVSLLNSCFGIELLVLLVLLVLPVLVLLVYLTYIFLSLLKNPGHWEHQLFYGKTGKTVNMVGKISSCLKYKNFWDSNLNRIPQHLSPGLGFIKKMQPYSKLELERALAQCWARTKQAQAQSYDKPDKAQKIAKTYFYCNRHVNF